MNFDDIEGLTEDFLQNIYWDTVEKQDLHWIGAYCVITTCCGSNCSTSYHYTSICKWGWDGSDYANTCFGYSAYCSGNHCRLYSTGYGPTCGYYMTNSNCWR